MKKSLGASKTRSRAGGGYFVANRSHENTRNTVCISVFSGRRVAAKDTPLRRKGVFRGAPLCILLIIALSLSTLQTPSHAQDLVAPCSTYTAEVDLIIDDDGLATVSITYLGDSSITYVRIVTYLQVIERGLWARVDIPATDDQWVVSTNGTSLSNTHTAQLPGMGHYRAFSQFTLTFSDGTVKNVYATCEEIY